MEAHQYPRLKILHALESETRDIREKRREKGMMKMAMHSETRDVTGDKRCERQHGGPSHLTVEFRFILLFHSLQSALSQCHLLFVTPGIKKDVGVCVNTCEHKEANEAGRVLARIRTDRPSEDA